MTDQKVPPASPAEGLRVPTESQIDHAAYMTADAGCDGDCRACHKAMTVAPGDDPTPMCNDCSQLFLIEAFPSILDGARLARIAADLLDKRGDSLVGILIRGIEDARTLARPHLRAEREATLAAIESTLVAFRGGRHVSEPVAPVHTTGIVDHLRSALATYKRAHEPDVGKMGFYAKSDDWDAVLAAIENARLAAELFEEHGERLLDWLETAAKHRLDSKGVVAAKALESTIAAFRAKGSE